MVGAKSCNMKLLRGRVPAWIKIPMSVAIPFRAFEKVLLEDVNKDIASKISSFYKCIKSGDLSKLQAIQETILQMNAPFSLTHELKNIIKSSRIPWPGDEGDDRWNQAWRAIKKVWASKWNERAFISCRKAKLDHENICMAVRNHLCRLCFCNSHKESLVREYSRNLQRYLRAWGRLWWVHTRDVP